MDELEKNSLAVRITKELLRNECKVLAIKMIRIMYNAELGPAKVFVEAVEKS